MDSKIRRQIADTVLMIEPIQFGFNDETAFTNSFQQKPDSFKERLIQESALNEFKTFVSDLEKLGIHVLVYRDTLVPFTPDSIFPNNWISTHASGELYTYPMAANNRREERRTAIIKSLVSKYGFDHVELNQWELEQPPIFLEGTGSMILDRVNRLCYAAISPRTNKIALQRFSEQADYEIVSFEAFGNDGEAIYHTNVMLSIGTTFACVGTETISHQDRLHVLNTLKSANKEVLEFSKEQIYTDFAGNMLQLRNSHDETVLVLSSKIFNHLTESQVNFLKKHNDHLLPVHVPTIEKIGGGSVRCMLAEIFKPD